MCCERQEQDTTGSALKSPAKGDPPSPGRGSKLGEWEEQEESETRSGGHESTLRSLKYAL